jgi:DNA-binding XRE family transcriptional regulator
LVHQVDREHRGPVLAAIESMTGARFVYDQPELAGWDVRIADAHRAKGIAPLACKTDRIDAWVLAELARRDLVPEIWLPDRQVRAERERARWRLHLVHKRTSLKNRVHAILFQHGLRAPIDDLFGVGGRRFLDYRAAHERLAPYEGIARFVIIRRAELGLTQEQLAERMGTSHSAISRIESGQHRTSVATLERLAQALEVRFVMGFETGPRDAPVRELVSV